MTEAWEFTPKQVMAIWQRANEKACGNKTVIAALTEELNKALKEHSDKPVDKALFEES